MELAPIDGEPYGKTASVVGAQPATYIRRTLNVTKKPVRARAYVSAKGLYQLSVDGKRVGADIFTPGWTDYKKRFQYQTYDLTSALAQGNHEIQLVLGDGWYAGHVGLAGRENYGPKPMGLCQVELEFADGTREVIATDQTWQVGEGPIRQNDLLMGETYDARVVPGGWASPEVQPLGEIPIVGQHSPTVQKLAELKPKAVTEPKPGVFVYDLGQNMVGWARLKVKGNAGDTVTLRFAEMLNPDGTIYVTNLRSAKCTRLLHDEGRRARSLRTDFHLPGFRYVEIPGSW